MPASSRRNITSVASWISEPSKTPQPDTMLLGAIVDGPEGSVFIRFTGPTALGAATEAEFRKLAESGIP